MRIRTLLILCILFVMGCKQEKGTAVYDERKDILKLDTTSSVTKVFKRVPITVYEGHCAYFEVEENRVCCYVDSQKIGEGLNLLYHSPSNSRYFYLMTNCHNNSNGWTVNYLLSKVDVVTHKHEAIGEFAAIHFEDCSFKAATTRPFNEDEHRCTAEEIWVMRDNYFDCDGVFIRQSEDEYFYDDMVREHGDTLVNATEYLSYFEEIRLKNNGKKSP